MGWLLGEVQDVKTYLTGLEVSPNGRCLFSKGLRINFQSSGHLELTAKEKRTHFSGGDNFNIVGIKEMAYHQVTSNHQVKH